jgi:hypothetical protein
LFVQETFSLRQETLSLRQETFSLRQETLSLRQETPSFVQEFFGHQLGVDRKFNLITCQQCPKGFQNRSGYAVDDQARVVGAQDRLRTD